MAGADSTNNARLHQAGDIHAARGLANASGTLGGNSAQSLVHGGAHHVLQHLHVLGIDGVGAVFSFS